ncbi:RNA exonuclease 1 homolog isoform 2-T2 [Anomaloglossus baeobatrachus]|uniref:RNA exonuclease 1 homolog isoform X2 n=1 Tax=Anomaloglossus baeobatrachus TaxID=238106 RepID=UPI003F4FA6C5
MLKNTGYFRGIKCPFSESCLRPHCVFRHGGRGVGSVRSEKGRSGAEYDPYSPDLPAVSPCMDKDFLGTLPKPSQHILELERVNKAIEEVQGQMERERRKYEELLASQNAKNSLQSESRFSFEYDPGCSGSNALCYKPNPASPSVKPCKYSLDNEEHNKSKRRHLEYIPTTITNFSRYRSNKYVIDNSKPHTDLEYDPMSNYSARHLSKVNPKKETKRCRTDSQDQSDAPVSKKVCNRTPKIMVEATFSDSEDDSPSQCSPKLGKPLISDKKSSSLTLLKSSECGTEQLSLRTEKEIAAPKDIVKCREPIKKIPNPLELKNEKTECIKSQHSTMVSDKKTCIAKEQKKASSKGHNKKKQEKGDAKCKDKLKEIKPKKNETPCEQTENIKDSLESLPKTPIIKQNKKDSENTSSRKKDPSTKDGDNRNRGHKAKKIEKSKKSCSAKKSRRALSHVDLFGDETSDEEENRKSGKQKKLTSKKDEQSTPKSKVAPRRDSVSVESPDIDTFSLDSDSDIDPMEECLRVFNESHDIKTEDKGRLGKQPNASVEKLQESSTALIPGQKRRISHLPSTNNVDSPSTAPVHPYRRLNPQEICYQRIQKAQEQAAQLLAQQKASLLPSITRESNPMKKIAKLSGSLPSIFCEKNAQSVSTGDTCNGSSAIKLRTPSGMASKTSAVTTKRRSHVPSLQSAALKRPVLPTEFGAKVPTTVRQRYLNLFIDECLKFCQPQEEAFNKALEEEKMVYSRSSSRNIYLSVAVNTLKKLRSQGSEKKPFPIANKKVVSHESVLGGKLAAMTSFSMQRNNQQEEALSEALLYNKLKRYALTPEQLIENSYPLVLPETSERLLIGDENKNLDTACKVCCRCGAEYLVTPKGKCVRKEECIHHWGRLRRQRVPGGWETHYSCCSGAVGSAGCQVAKQHVQDGRKDSLVGFVKTFEKLHTNEGSPGVFALDCEMCYTTKGLELTRVTVINYQLKVVYDTYVLPDNKIVDYNTRFSGITAEDLQNTTITLRDVQAVLLSMFSCDSVLIGHSLESDLYALKLIHPTVVDTAIVFPHRLGLPYKRALRSLMADYLQRIIQDNVDGHDSSEDACSCMELMIWRLKEDAKVKR